jgi:hypothetical protein
MPGDSFGQKVSMSCNGDIIAISAAEGQSFAGYVKIFKEVNGNWIKIGQTIVGQAIDALGIDISLSCDGNSIALESLRNNGVNTSTVRIFQSIDNTWTQIGQTIEQETFGSESGTSISLSCDANVVAIGDPKSGMINNFARGRTRIYELNSGIWTQIGQDIDGENQIGNAGFSVSLSCIGDIVAIGARNNNPVPGGGNRGHVRVYKNISNSWMQIGQDIDGLDNLDLLGSSVSLSSDGSVVASGAIEFDFSGVPVNDISTGYVTCFNIASELALLEVIDDILGNANGENVTANQLNRISGVSRAIEGVNYTTALDNGTFVDENNPTASEIQAIIDQVNETLTLSDINTLEFKLYPNPTKTQFTIQLENRTALTSVQIYNNLGQLVLTSKETIINTSKLASGLYIVEIETDQGKSSTKLIIE